MPHERQLRRELLALSVDPVFAAQFVARLRECLIRQREEALLVAIFGETARSKESVMSVMSPDEWRTADSAAARGGGDKLPGEPYPGPHPTPTPDGGPGVPNPPKAL
ncbi:hypothetical protein FCH28_33160 [Streptomyces piniterrae]|uniref:Uncharacterized protein n=1 Tax=Streptomyces piniterrae TaxID=2571125 RepID=A0A4U0MPT4_9ACTN|nr:hypothetical protein [Streptomyces piniterrae]TJZ42753.1 hypothetical protein FCH28_33160 [Streptomyces piniterrae]